MGSRIIRFDERPLCAIDFDGLVNLQFFGAWPHSASVLAVMVMAAELLHANPHVIATYLIWSDAIWMHRFGLMPDLIDI
jgi:hypothetical protein